VTKKKKRKDPWVHEHEPLPEAEDWVEFSGERIWPAGFTEGGFPYGLSEEDFRRMNAEHASAVGWARARHILEVVLGGREPGTSVDVGYVKKMGQGLSRDVYAAEVEVRAPSGREIVEAAVLLPRRDADPGLGERSQREAHLLSRLANIDLPFRVPRFFGLYPDGSRLGFVREGSRPLELPHVSLGAAAPTTPPRRHRRLQFPLAPRCRAYSLVRSFERGVELDLRAGRQGRVVPWQKVGAIAAAIHRIGPAALPGLRPRYATRRDHAEAAIEELGEMTEPEGREAHAWATEHLPPASPSTLVHGDLLGQNILVGFDERDAVIDWEYAQFGDPAYDLAIVTRGVRRPFQIEKGMERLLDAYANAGGAEVTRAHIHLHELAMVGGWYQDALEGRSRHAPPHYLQLLRGLLGRARI
jgi:hypothetical protein